MAKLPAKQLFSRAVRHRLSSPTPCNERLYVEDCPSRVEGFTLAVRKCEGDDINAKGSHVAFVGNEIKRAREQESKRARGQEGKRARGQEGKRAREQEGKRARGQEGKRARGQ
jgi:hypothetical protein